MSWLSALVLNDGEKLVHSWNGILTHHIVVRKVHHRRLLSDKVHTAKKKEHQKGILALTNQRLLWLQRRGRIKKSYHLTHHIELSKLSAVSMGGTLFKYVTLSDGEDTYQFNLSKVGSKEFEYFKDMVLRQKEQVSTTVVPQASKQVITREVVLIPCNYCKGLMPQTSIFCPNCGAPRKN